MYGKENLSEHMQQKQKQVQPCYILTILSAMLIRLLIRNFALIEKCVLDVQSNFSVVTGETGAGKSMFIDALAFSLGNSITAAYIRPGAENLQVEAIFAPKESATLNKWLNENDIELDDGELIIKRSLAAGGKTRSFVNDARITQGKLKELGEFLADIHGQHDQQILLKPSNHTALLDHFGDYANTLQNVKNNYKAWKEATQKLIELENSIANREQEETLLKAYVEELETLDYQQDEESGLAEERRQLMAAEETLEAVQIALSALDDEDGGAAARLGQAARALEDAGRKAGGQVAEVAERLNALYHEASELGRDVGYLADAQLDPTRLQAVDDRLTALQDCARKHQVSVPELGKKQADLRQKLENMEALEGNIEDLKRQVAEKEAVLRQEAKMLSKARQKNADALSKSVEMALADLKMPETKFVPVLIPLDENEMTAQGCERVEFRVKTNAAQTEPKPLVDVASGGEVSRLMLALKAVFYSKLPEMTLVFDEVDTGIGGAVADAVGRALAKLGQRHQVIAITHQPQVAAKGLAHIHISKAQEAQKTTTSVTNLQEDARRDEIARMLAGAEVTDAARQAAESLLRS